VLSPAGHSAHPALSHAPLVNQFINHPDPLRHLYTVTPNLETDLSPDVEAPNVAFVVKISFLENGHSNYLWQVRTIDSENYTTSFKLYSNLLSI